MNGWDGAMALGRFFHRVIIFGSTRFNNLGQGSLGMCVYVHCLFISGHCRVYYAICHAIAVILLLLPIGMWLVIWLYSREDPLSFFEERRGFLPT